MACAAALAACSATPEPAGGSAAPVDRVADGRRFALLNCANCHAMDQADFSPNPSAPPMKRLLPRLDFKMLQRQPSRELDMTHGNMPPLRLGLMDKEALAAYLKSIADPPVR